MFSDEKYFDQDGQINRQNDRVYAISRSVADLKGGLRETHKFPFKVMVWLGVTFKGATEVFILQSTSLKPHPLKPHNHLNRTH